MNVTCQDCRSVFRVDPAKVPASGVRARCSVCGALIRIASVATSPTPVATPRQPTPAGVGGLSAWDAGTGRATPAQSPALPPFDAGMPTPAGQAPVADGFAPSQPTPQWTTPMPTPVPPSVAVPTPLGAPALPTPIAQPALPTPPAAPRVPTPPPIPAVPTPSMPTPTVAPRPLVPPPPMSPAQLVTPATAAPVAPARPAAPVGPDGKRIINPFLKSDPQVRAKRLARALVSDMVAYHAAKRAEALANGTLKQAFRDEIRRSYDEYVDQVGRELAESTTYFQEALNEVLAEGRPLF